MSEVATEEHVIPIGERPLVIEAQAQFAARDKSRKDAKKKVEDWNRVLLGYDPMPAGHTERTARRAKDLAQDEYEEANQHALAAEGERDRVLEKEGDKVENERRPGLVELTQDMFEAARPAEEKAQAVQRYLEETARLSQKKAGEHPCFPLFERFATQKRSLSKDGNL